jgi:ketosteroid isomerase-like protein
MPKRMFIALMCLSMGVFAQEPDHAIHEELRGLIHRVEEAVNSEKYEAMGDCFTEHLSITTINQEVLSTRGEIGPYFRKWFGPGGYLKKLHMTLNADALTELNAEKTYGLARGSGVEDYILSDGRFFPMRTRWTATVVKDADGHWRIRAIHIGTDFLNNPILTKAEHSLGWAAGAGLLLGLVLGLGTGWLILRKRRA